MSPLDKSQEGTSSGTARRAVLRWAWRVARRDRRGLRLLVGLTTVVAAVSAGGLTAIPLLVDAESTAVFGSADHTIELLETDQRSLEVDAAAIRERFGTAEVVPRQEVTVPGLFEPVEVSEQTGPGPFTQPLRSLLAGRYPAAPGEVALSPVLAGVLSVGLGDTVQLGAPLRVVGLVENPADLGQDLALVAELPGEPESALAYLDAPAARFDGFSLPSGSAIAVGERLDVGLLAGGLVLVATTVLLTLVALVAVTAFSIIARRRLRQLGLLAAIGAQQRHLRLVMTLNGALIGVVSSLGGSGTALLAWFLLADRLEPVVAHRIDETDIPWIAIGASMVLTVVACTMAATAASRELLRVPVVTALSGRPPLTRPQTLVRTLRPAVLLAAGLALLWLAGPLDSIAALLLTVAGTGLTIAAAVAGGPLVIGLAGRVGPSVAAPIRLAARDLARYRKRSGAALAALSLIVGLGVAVVATTAAAAFAADEGNLSDRQLMLRVGEIPSQGDVAPVPERAPGEIEQLDEAAARIATELDAGTIVPVDVAVIPDLEIAGGEGLPLAVVTVDLGGGLSRIVDLVYVASDELLAQHGIERLEAGTALATTRSEDLLLEPLEREPIRPQRLDASYSSVPGTFITPAEVDRRGWTPARAGWLIETPEPISDDDFEIVRQLAAGAGISAERRATQAELSTLRDAATGVAVLAGLGVIALTVGLVRNETTTDRRILEAIGSTRRQQRTLAATVSGTLAGLAAVTGTTLAYLALLAQSGRGAARLWPIPVWHLALLAGALPLVATLGAWVLSAGPATVGISRPRWWR